MNTEEIKEYLSQIEVNANSLLKACAVLNKQLEGIKIQTEERKIEQERYNIILESIAAKQVELKQIEDKKNQMNEEMLLFAQEKELMEKEKVLARDRKMALDQQEEKLKIRSARIQQILGE